jgi:hypothetical protein
MASVTEDPQVRAYLLCRASVDNVYGRLTAGRDGGRGRQPETIVGLVARWRTFTATVDGDAASTMASKEKTSPGSPSSTFRATP